MPWIRIISEPICFLTDHLVSYLLLYAVLAADILVLVSGFVDRFPQPTLPVPLVPIFEYSDFYPKSSSPKAAINNPSESRSSDGEYTVSYS